MSKTQRTLWLNATVFLTGAGIMTVELVASRLIARFLGSSLYTWTGVLGVILAGMSLGNYLGGRMADSARNLPGRIAAMLFVLFLLPYAAAAYTSQYTVYNNMAGLNGSIEQICSVVLLCFALLPIPFLLMKQTVTKRNLPVTMSAVSAGAIAIYSAVIWFGSMNPTAVPFLIILSAAAEVLCTVKYIEALKAMDNLMFRPQAL